MLRTCNLLLISTDRGRVELGIELPSLTTGRWRLGASVSSLTSSLASISSGPGEVVAEVVPGPRRLVTGLEAGGWARRLVAGLGQARGQSLTRCHGGGDVLGVRPRLVLGRIHRG